MSVRPFERSSEPAESASGVDLRTMGRQVWRERARVGAVTLAAMLLTLGIAFLLPKWYRATAVILPPEEADLLSNLTMAGRALSKFPTFGELGEYFTPADIFKAILKSRTVQESVVDQFQLMKVYHLGSREKTLKALGRNTGVKLAPDGTITVSVEDRDPKRAAAMAMAMLESLDRYNIEKRNTQAHRTRVFLERRVAETDSLLRANEKALREYQESHHAVVPASLSSADVSASANLMAQKIALEVRLGVLRSYLREDNEQVVQTLNELEQLNRRIGALPALQTALQRLIRDTRVQEQLYLLLTAELEHARIQETQDTPTVQVLDPAVPPERHSRPRKLLLALAAGVLAFAGSALYVALRGGSVMPARS